MDRTLDNAVDAILVAAAGILEAEQLRALAEQVEHLAQLVDDRDQAAETYRAAAALRAFADNLD